MSELRTARQFAGLDQLRSRFAVQSLEAQRRQRADNERRYCAWLAQMFPGEAALETAARQVSEAASRHSNLQMRLIDEILPLGSGWRVEATLCVAPGHPPLPPDQIQGALERLFEWTGDEAFAELHAVEQTALSQARLLEIFPFARLNVPLAGALSYFWFLKAGFVFPVWEHYQPGKYEQALEAAFHLDMQPLVDHLLFGERAALQAALGE
ncbi:MAG: hypothetical protein HY315_05000 [Acidobacteria bacterium]|nr:hypothetical protein [Acidobacteriota bacterium]